MKKIFALSISALLIIGIVGGGTWAYFSDTATSNGNTWTAGTLVLSEVTLGASENTTFTGSPTATGGINGNVAFSGVKPGSSGSLTWTLNNTGNVPGTLTLVALNTFDENLPETVPEHAADGTDAIGLGQRLLVWVTRDGTPILGTTGTYVAMSGLQTALNLEINRTVTIGTPMVYILNWQVPTGVGNEIQGDTATLNITFTLNQTP